MRDLVSATASADLDHARAIMGAAEHVLVLTGAGISAESGVPTFRGPDGLWKSYRAEELATPDAFARDPRLVWEWYGWRRDIIAACSPNAAHEALAVAASTRDDVRIVTQNVDGLHAAAARTRAAVPLELHGSLFRVRCTRCGARRDDRSRIDARTVDTLPRCDVCGALARPDVVWFGEALDATTFGTAMELATAADVCLVIGTSALVYPAAGLATLTHDHGGAIIEVNVEATPLTSRARVTLRGPASTVVPALLSSDQHPA